MLCKNFFYWSFLFIGMMTFFTGYSQTDTIKDYSFFERKFSLQSFIVGRYGASMNENIDYSGMHYINSKENGEEVVNNSFEMQYVRLSTSFKVNDRFSSSILVNLADFKNENLSSKVLENAFINYSQNVYFNIRLGQFRPYFGLEGSYPFQLNNSYKWSNQYSLFGRNAWQSFQIGAAFYGNLTPKKIPLYYYFTVYNGNNKNQQSDNNSAKNYALRFEYYPIKYLQVGINAAVSDDSDFDVNAYGVDTQFRYPMNDLWQLDINAEYKKGTNILDFQKEKQKTNSSITDYALFRLKYILNAPRIRALEFSFRGEYLDYNIKKRGDILREHVPMVSLVFARDYDAKLSLVGVISDYQTNIPGTKQYDHSKILIQNQIAFK